MVSFPALPVVGIYIMKMTNVYKCVLYKGIDTSNFEPAKFEPWGYQLQ